MEQHTKIDIKNFTLPQLEAYIAGLGKERFRARQIFKWLYQRDAASFAQMTDVSKEFRAYLEETACIGNLSVEALEISDDGTRKYLFRLDDGAAVESVLIPDEGRNTLCISSQVGCAMGCAFCLTGTFGLARNLTTSEIVNQVCAVQRDQPVRNIVFMGMGEPLANLAAVIPAVKILTDPDGFQFSTRKVTVSTSGLVPEMAELGRSAVANLAVSVNATTDEVRNRIMPINQSYPLSALIKACREFPLPSRRWITVEYVLIRGLNDTLDDAKRLVRMISHFPSKVNLIPFNEHDGCDFLAPTQESIDRFHKYLLDKNVTVITRSSRGGDISAACGQLKGRLDELAGKRVGDGT